MTMKLFLKRTAPFSILWTLTNYLYVMALKKLTATDVSTLYCCHKAFVFLLSWIVLKDRFMGVRVSPVCPAHQTRVRQGLFFVGSRYRHGCFVSMMMVLVEMMRMLSSVPVDRGSYHGHHRHCDDGIRRRFPRRFHCGRGLGCGLCLHIGSLQGKLTPKK